MACKLRWLFQLFCPETQATLEPRFTTAEEAYETYRLAMQQHNWATAFDAYLPESQAGALYFAFGTTPRTSTKKAKQFESELKELYARHGLKWEWRGNLDFVIKLQDVKDKQACFIDAMELQKKLDLLYDDSRWDEMKEPTVRQQGDSVEFEYKIKIRPGLSIRDAKVFEKQGDRWGINLGKSVEASTRRD